MDDIIALYSCEPTVRRVERYTPDCVYDDQFVYANDRYKVRGSSNVSDRKLTHSRWHVNGLVSSSAPEDEADCTVRAAEAVQGLQEVGKQMLFRIVLTHKQ